MVVVGIASHMYRDQRSSLLHIASPQDVLATVKEEMQSLRSGVRVPQKQTPLAARVGSSTYPVAPGSGCAAVTLFWALWRGTHRNASVKLERNTTPPCAPCVAARASSLARARGHPPQARPAGPAGWAARISAPRPGPAPIPMATSVAASGTLAVG